MIEANVQQPAMTETIQTTIENGSLFDLSEINAQKEGYNLVGWVVTYKGKDIYSLDTYTEEVTDYKEEITENEEDDEINNSEDDSTTELETNIQISETELTLEDDEIYTYADGFNPDDIELTEEEKAAIEEMFPYITIPQEELLETKEVSFNCRPDDVILIDADTSITAVWSLTDEEVETIENESEQQRQKMQEESDKEIDRKKEAALREALDEKIFEAYQNFVIEKETENILETEELTTENESESENDGISIIDITNGDDILEINTDEPTDLDENITSEEELIYNDFENVDNLEYGDLYYKNYAVENNDDSIVSIGMIDEDSYQKLQYNDYDMLDLSELTEFRKGYYLSGWEVTYKSNNEVDYDNVVDSLFGTSDFIGDDYDESSYRYLNNEIALDDVTLSESERSNIETGFSYVREDEYGNVYTTFHMPTDAVILVMHDMEIKALWQPDETKTINDLENDKTNGCYIDGKTAWDNKLNETLHDALYNKKIELSYQKELQNSYIEENYADYSDYLDNDDYLDNNYAEENMIETDYIPEAIETEPVVQQVTEMQTQNITTETENLNSQ